jgi:outer membrane autotransporter protein
MKLADNDPADPGNVADYDNTTSLRLGAGLRGSFERTVFEDLRLGLTLTGRLLNETDGEAKVTIVNPGSTNPTVVDKFDGSFGEVIGGVTLANSTGRVSGALNVGSKFGDDYDALSASASFRYQW